MSTLKRLLPVAALLAVAVLVQSAPMVGAVAGSASGSLAERAASIFANGNGFNCWVDSGAARCIGVNSVGQLGDSTTVNRTAAVTVSGLSSGVVSITAGDSHACALTSSGAVKCWGSNTRGQIGDGSTSNSLVPVQVSGLSSGVVRIDADAENTCAVTDSGRVLCWGSNQTYGAGSTTADANADGEADPVLVPTEVTGMSGGATDVAVGGTRVSASSYYSHGCALMASGAVKCWGDNAYGELGTTAAGPVAVPADVAIGTTATAVSVGIAHSCVLTGAGGVKCWGQNSTGQLGNGTSTAVAAGTIVDMAGASTGVVQVSAGGSVTCIVTSAAALMCAGNSMSDLIRRTLFPAVVSTPEIVHGLSSNVVAVSTSFNQMCALRTNGSLGCWANNSYGQTGDGYAGKILYPQTVATSASNPAPLTGFTALGTSMWASCGIRTGGSVTCWGYNASGQLGDGTQSNQPVPLANAQVTTGAVSLSTASGSSVHTHCAIMSDTSVKCWGANAYGLKGFGSSTASDYSGRTMLASTGPDVPLTGITSVSASLNNACVVTNGAVKCAGGNLAGALGDGSGTASNLPVQVSGITSGAVAVATASSNSACAVMNDGTVKCWGNGQQYQMGNNSVANAPTPVQVSNINDATAITSGDYFYCALVTAGGVKCWGNNSYGQLGDGTTTSPRTPVTVSGLTGATSIVAGLRSVCAVMSDTTVKCWGWNYHGIFGNGTTTDSLVPVSVPNLTGVTSLALGGTHICALMSDTTVKCWGSEQGGQVGNNTMQNRPFDGSTYAATGLVIPASLPSTTTTTTTTTTLTTTTTTTTVAPVTTTTVAVASTNQPVRHDPTVYSTPPAMAGGVAAYSILNATQLKNVRLVTRTPYTCVAGGVYVITLKVGDCAVAIASLKDGRTMSVWRTKVVDAALGTGSTVRVGPSLRYGWMYDKATPAALRGTYALLKHATFALAVGHAALFTGASRANQVVSERRARNVVGWLDARNVDAVLAWTGVGSRAPVTRILTETEQSRNRVVNIYYVP